MPKIGPADCLETRPVREEWGASGLEERSQIGARLDRDNAPPAKTGGGTGDEAEPGGIARNEANARGPPNSGFGRKVGVKLAISLRGPSRQARPSWAARWARASSRFQSSRGGMGNWAWSGCKPKKTKGECSLKWLSPRKARRFERRRQESAARMTAGRSEEQ